MKADTLLKDALYALNSIHRTKLNHETYKDTYQLAAAITEYLANTEPHSFFNNKELERLASNDWKTFCSLGYYIDVEIDGDDQGVCELTIYSTSLSEADGSKHGILFQQNYPNAKEASQDVAGLVALGFVVDEI